MADEFSIHILEEITIDNIIKIEYNQQSLQANFELLVKYLRGLGKGFQTLKQENIELKKENQVQNSEIADLKDKTQQQDGEILNLKQDQKKQQEQINKNADEIQKLWDALNQLKDQLNSILDRLQNLESRMGDVESQLGNILDRMKEIENLCKDLKLSNEKLNGEMTSLQSIEAPTGSIGEIDHNYVQKPDFKQKCEENDQEHQKIWDFLDNLQLKAEDIDKFVKELNNKITKELEPQVNSNTQQLEQKTNQQEFESEINYIKELIKSLQDGLDGEGGSSNSKGGQKREIIMAPIKQTPPVSQTIIQQNNVMDPNINKKLEKLQEALDMIEDLKKQLQQLRKDHEDTKTDTGYYKSRTDKRLDDLEKALKNFAMKNDVDRLFGNIKEIRDELDQTSNLAHENEKRIKEFKRILDHLMEKVNSSSFNNNNNMAQMGSGNSDGVSQEYVDQQIKKLRDDLLALLKALKDELDKKVTFDDLWKSEALILEKLDEVAGALLKKLADKGDTKKALIYLEKKINQLYMLITKEGGQNGQGQRTGEEDALIAKRPLFWSCLSCEKGLDNFQGKLGDYRGWGVFPPKETTPERMGRFGKGYKTMLEKTKLKEERMRMEQNSQNDNLPTINKTPGMSGTQGKTFGHN